MQVKLVTVAFDPSTGAFPPDPLKDIGSEVVQVVEHFFHHQGLPHLLLIAHCRPAQEKRRRDPGPTRQSSGSEQLSPDERELFDRIRLCESRTGLDEVGRMVGGWIRHQEESLCPA